VLRRGQTCWKTRSAGLPAVKAYWERTSSRPQARRIPYGRRTGVLGD